MNRTKLILGVLLFLAPDSHAQIRHTSKSDTDRVLQCARSILGKPVYATMSGPRFDSSFLCPEGRQELLDQLEERKIGVLENDSAVILIPTYRRPELGDPHYRIRWHKFNDIDVHVQEVDPTPPGSRPLTASEREEISGTILREALTPPLSTPLDADAGEDTANIEVSLLLDAHRLSPKVESVVGILGGSRLVYGELQDGHYRVVWDSPLGGPGIGPPTYKDVDGDGVPEIVLSWVTSTYYTSLVVFNSEGKELTRQEQCKPDVGDPTQSACAILGVTVDFENTNSGKQDILVVPNTESDSAHPKRYTLVHGRYTLPVPVLTNIAPASIPFRTVGKKMILTGRNFIPGSIIRFTPVSDQHAEVVVGTKFISSTKLEARFEELVSRAGEWKVRVENTSAHSAELTFHVVAPRVTR